MHLAFCCVGAGRWLCPSPGTADGIEGQGTRPSLALDPAPEEKIPPKPHQGARLAVSPLPKEGEGAWGVSRGKHGSSLGVVGWAPETRPPGPPLVHLLSQDPAPAMVLRTPQGRPLGGPGRRPQADGGSRLLRIQCVPGPWPRASFVTCTRMLPTAVHRRGAEAGDTEDPSPVPRQVGLSQCGPPHHGPGRRPHRGPRRRPLRRPRRRPRHRPPGGPRPASLLLTRSQGNSRCHYERGAEPRGPRVWPAGAAWVSL